MENAIVSSHITFAILLAGIIVGSVYLIVGALIADWQCDKLYPAEFHSRAAAMSLALLCLWPLYPWLIAWWRRRLKAG